MSVPANGSIIACDSAECVDPSYLEMIELGAELAQDFRRSVGGHVVGNEDAIACSGDVEERLADEAVLVPDQRDPDDLHGCF